ncbi:sirohydrochlorin chelatase [Streptomyces aurantiacus]|uniref:Putative Sirohydrochlorin cobaltochelatase n=1 Tax=Streptomyces aurantiacus JA 4570 TaxID=1286094 RepID=S4A7C4_9ACTN|nr:sirohydrochlorin chelatase [Streptomyces aurantiacus]EPH46660.1 putative Sirohydrochlorin cobaltochelatase [Streptomyces aurantiacus JA 4570]
MYGTFRPGRRSAYEAVRRPVLLVVAHGSRDPRHAASVRALLRTVRGLRPGLRVEVGFLDFNTPSVPSVLGSLAEEGVRDVIALPLLLTRAFHAKADIPAVLREAPPGLRVRQAGVLGPSPLLLAALETRLYEAGLDPADKPTTGVVLASAGSSDPEAIAVIADIAREWRHTGWCAVRPAFASATLPLTSDAVRELRATPGVRQVAVAPYVLAPGFLPDRIARGAAEADVLADVLGDSPLVARLLLDRFDSCRRFAADRSHPPTRAGHNSLPAAG